MKRSNELGGCGIKSHANQRRVLLACEACSRNWNTLHQRHGSRLLVDPADCKYLRVQEGRIDHRTGKSRRFDRPVKVWPDAWCFGFKNHPGLPACRCQRRFHTWDAFSVARVEQLQLIPCLLTDQTGAVGGAVHALIVHEHEAPIASALDIHFDKIDAQVNALADGGYCVLWSMTCGSTMADSKNPLAIPLTFHSNFFYQPAKLMLRCATPCIQLDAMQQESPRSGYEEAFVDVTGARLHYLHAGTGAPVFLIHGLVGSSENWHNNIDALTQNASVYAIDWLNMGESQGIEGLDASLRANANRIVRAMDSLGLAQADIVGHSYGGAIALMLAALYPRRVRRLILFAPANPYSHSSDLIVRIYSTVWGRFVARMLPFLPAAIQRIALGALYGGPDRIGDSCLQEIIDVLRCPSTLRHILSIIRCWFAEMATLKAALRRVARIPTLLVWGDRDLTVSLDSGIRLHHRLRQSELIVMPGGHSLFEESPEESNRIMLEWLGRHSFEAPIPATAPARSHSRPRDRARSVSIAAKTRTAPAISPGT